MRKTIVASLVPRAYPVLLGFARTDVRSFFIAREPGAPPAVDAAWLAAAEAAGLTLQFGPEAANVGAAQERVAAILAAPAFRTALEQLPESERTGMATGVGRLAPPAFANAIALIDALDALAEHDDVRGVIVTDDASPLARSLIRWARARGVPSLMLTHGATRHMRFVPDKLVDDHYLYSEQVVPTLLDAGVRADQIHLGPFFGHLDHRDVDPGTGAAFRTQHGIAADDVVVVLTLGFDQFLSALEPPHFWFVAMMVSFLRAIRVLRDRGIACVPVVKHRWHDPAVEGAVSTTARELGLEVIFFSGPMVELLPATDVLCAPDSNTLIEAALYDIPLVDLVYAWHWLVGPYYAAEDGIPYADAADPGRLADLLAPLVTQPEARRRSIAATRDLARRLVSDRTRGIDDIAADLLAIVERRRLSAS